MTKEQSGDKIKRSTNRDVESESRASAPRVLLMADDEIIRDLAAEMLIQGVVDGA